VFFDRTVWCADCWKPLAVGLASLRPKRRRLGSRDFLESLDGEGEVSEACADEEPAVMRSLVDAEREERRSGG